MFTYSVIEIEFIFDVLKIYHFQLTQKKLKIKFITIILIT